MSIGIRAPGMYIQGVGELSKLGFHARKLGERFFVLCTNTTWDRLGAVVEESLRSMDKDSVFWDFGGLCTWDEVERVRAAYEASGCDVLVGMGGGRVIDTVKAVSDRLGGCPVAAIPTVASTAAPCSDVSVLYDDSGVGVRVQLTRSHTDLVLVDTEVIARSPARFLAAGMGVALSTWFETRAFRGSGAHNQEQLSCSHAVFHMTRLTYQLLLQDGIPALRAVEHNECDQHLENVLEACFYLTGVSVASGGLAAAHAISDGLARLPGAERMFYGERVAFGVLVQLVLEDTSKEQWEEVFAFCKAVGLPTNLMELGVEQLDPAALLQVGEIACEAGRTMDNLRPGVTPEEVRRAILRVDEIGRRYG